MEPLQFVPYVVRNKYPHMGPEDTAIWTRFIIANPSAFDAVAYDVAVGTPPVFDTVVNAETGGNNTRLHLKKIDVIGAKKDVLYVIEVKPAAGASAVGQVKNYRMLFKRDYTPKQALTMAIVTDRISPDLELFAEEERVGLFVA